MLVNHVTDGFVKCSVVASVVRNRNVLFFRNTRHTGDVRWVQQFGKVDMALLSFEIFEDVMQNCPFVLGVLP